MPLELSSRRGIYIDIAEEIGTDGGPLSDAECRAFEEFDLVYRSTCALLFNYVPTSGHPGGSISSGRFVAALLFDALDYDLSDPHRMDADIISYAAGHKALGLYTMWALRNEIAKQAAPELLPKDIRNQLRMEDLLGFRRNPVTRTPLFVEFRAKPLDGHPTPATPFVRLATGASGVGVSTSLGLALGAADLYGTDAPQVHIVEGEGGLTPGRVAEALAAAGTASLGNATMHLDWNQASIDSNHVCRENGKPGEYVQWNPAELAYLHDWNVISVPDGKDFQQIVAAQRRAAALDNGQPTAIIYRTTKGWQYGIEGKASHGAGHAMCSARFFDALAPLADRYGIRPPSCDPQPPELQRCDSGADAVVVEQCFWEALSSLRTAMSRSRPMLEAMAGRLQKAQERLNGHGRRRREGAPRVEAVFETAQKSADVVPPELVVAPNSKTTLRGELGRVLDYLNQASDGALLIAAADLLGSTSILTGGKGFAEGYYNRLTNPGSRVLTIGGICEDAMSGMLSGLSTYGGHVGAGASYGAFIAPLGHIAARLHAIGNQARRETMGEAYSPFILVCAHAGLKTGEDGPTHADPQAVQLLQDNFPKGTMITLTPWDPQEVWPLMAAALTKRPAVIAPFVTRPSETVLDRQAFGLAPATAAAQGVYALRKARGKGDGVVVLQGSGVTYAFVQETLPLLDREGIDITAYYVASSELFELLPAAEQERIFPEQHAQITMGITGLTLPTMYRWITSARGRAATLHPYMKGHYLGSGQADKVLLEAGLDGHGQFEAIQQYLRDPVGSR
ncbi:MAG: transketolase family protein [Planctomycetota bacterium]|jgi:transketolase